MFDSKGGELEVAAKGRRPDPLEVKIEKAWKRRLDLAKRRMKAHDEKSPRSRRRAWGKDYFAAERRLDQALGVAAKAVRAREADALLTKCWSTTIR